jgi:mycothiol synthase
MFAMGSAKYTIRTYHPRDFDDYVQFHIETEAHDGFGSYLSKQHLAEELGHPSFQPEKNLFFAEQDGCLIGYVSAFLEPGIGRVLLDGAVHPSHRRKGMATELFNCAIRHARQAELNAAQICISEANTPAKKMALRFDMKFTRHFIEFKLDLAGIQLPDVAPGEYIVRQLQSGEEDHLTAIQNISFAESWGFNPNTTAEILYRVHLSSCSPEDIIMAYRKDQPVGYCWTRILTDETSKTKTRIGEIHMIGVDPDFRGRRLGRIILLAGLSHLKRKGIEKVELTADAEDPAARRLYESAGFTEGLKAEWYEKTLP